MSTDTMREALELIAAPRRPDGTWNRDREACRQLAAAALAQREAGPVASGPAQVTDAMVDAYLKANDAYWHAVDNMPLPARNPGVWRNGTPKEATRISLIAALAASPQEAQPVHPLSDDDVWNSQEIMSINGARAGLTMPVLMDLVRAIERLITERAAKEQGS